MSCNSTSDHSFFGYWEVIKINVLRTLISKISAFFQIIESHFDSSLSENLGLNGIKFLLDESGDIIWFNDLFSIQVVSVNDDQQSSPTIWLSKSMADDEKSKYSTGNESADIFFSCETFEVVNLDMDHLNGPGLLFRSFTGHHIEFRTGSVNPMEHMTLNCEGLLWKHLGNDFLTIFLVPRLVHVDLQANQERSVDWTVHPVHAAISVRGEVLRRHHHQKLRRCFGKLSKLPPNTQKKFFFFLV